MSAPSVMQRWPDADAPLEAGIVCAGEDYVLRPRALAGHPRLQAVGLPAVRLRQPRLPDGVPSRVREGATQRRKRTARGAPPLAAADGRTPPGHRRPSTCHSPSPPTCTCTAASRRCTACRRGHAVDRGPPRPPGTLPLCRRQSPQPRAWSQPSSGRRTRLQAPPSHLPVREGVSGTGCEHEAQGKGDPHTLSSPSLATVAPWNSWSWPRRTPAASSSAYVPATKAVDTCASAAAAQQAGPPTVWVASVRTATGGAAAMGRGDSSTGSVHAKRRWTP